MKDFRNVFGAWRVKFLMRILSRCDSSLLSRRTSFFKPKATRYSSLYNNVNLFYKPRETGSQVVKTFNKPRVPVVDLSVIKRAVSSHKCKRRRVKKNIECYSRMKLQAVSSTYSPAVLPNTSLLWKRATSTARDFCLVCNKIFVSVSALGYNNREMLRG